MTDSEASEQAIGSRVGRIATLSDLRMKDVHVRRAISTGAEYLQQLRVGEGKILVQPKIYALHLSQATECVAKASHSEMPINPDVSTSRKSFAWRKA